MLYTCVFQQSFDMTFGVRKIKGIVRLNFKETWEGGFKGLH